MGNKKLQVWLPLIFSLVMIAGMFFGYRLNSTGNKKGFFQTSKISTLQEALDVIRLNYVDPVNLDSIESGAIQQMMSELDPHSVYFPPVELKQANEELAGSLEGIGVEFNVFNDTINVVYVMPDGPSDQAGILIGDKIIKANDSSLTTPGIDVSYIRSHLLGPKGSVVSLQVLRNGQLKNMPVTRGVIPKYSVDAVYMIDKTIGYIKLDKFTETSYVEVMKALEDLKSRGMKQLIFDLRGNGGGYMDRAIDMADEFLDGDKLIVYTQGAKSKKRDYRCKRPGLFEEGRLAILTDELSASASEVLSGALQDWDRATIIGRRTFGKGLVQEQFGLSDGSALRLTIARYYTPLGRSIQRPYDKGKKIYMDEIWERHQNGESLNADSAKFSNGQAYHTPSGHTVYGGGGIMPDIFVPIDTATYPAGINSIIANGSFNNFIYMYYLQHRKLVDQYPSVNDFVTQFPNKDDLWNRFVNFAAGYSVQLGSLNAKQKETLLRRLEAYLIRFKWRNSGLYQVLNADDPVMIKAVEVVKK